MFEYPTLNGGERSMLGIAEQVVGAVIEFVALSPPEGRLKAAVDQLGIRHVPLEFRDEQGNRLPREAICENLLEAVRDCEPHLVHANSLSMGRLTGALVAEFPVPTIAHLRDILGVSRAAVSDLNQNTLLLAVSEATKAFHVSQGVDATRIRRLYNGVDCRQFEPRRSTGALLRELGLPLDAFLIATIGQIGLRKGQDVLTRAAVRAASRMPTAHYLLVGERNSTKQESIEFEQSIIREFADTGLDDRLHRLGYRDDVASLFNEIDLLVHPAHQEPLGRVLLEAAASGVPIVATDVGGTNEILSDGESALLIPPNDPTALAEAMCELYNDVSKRNRLAAAARAHIETEFPIDRAARELVQLWRDVATRNV